MSKSVSESNNQNAELGRNMDAAVMASSSSLLGKCSIAASPSSQSSAFPASLSANAVLGKQMSLARTPCLSFAVQDMQQLRQRRGLTTGLRPVLPPAATADAAVALDTEIPIEKRFAAFPTVLDIHQIRNILPHRFPFLLVDRVIEYNPGVSAVAIKNVTINDNFFPGHFPERPIMPGVLMVEAMAQVGGIVMLTPEIGGSKESFFFAGVDRVRFRKPVVAGDTLVMRMTLIKLQKRFGIAKMDGKAYVGGEVVCEGEFLMALGSDES